MPASEPALLLHRKRTQSSSRESCGTRKPHGRDTAQAESPWTRIRSSPPYWRIEQCRLDCTGWAECKWIPTERTPTPWETIELIEWTIDGMYAGTYQTNAFDRSRHRMQVYWVVMNARLFGGCRCYRRRYCNRYGWRWFRCSCCHFDDELIIYWLLFAASWRNEQKSNQSWVFSVDFQATHYHFILYFVCFLIACSSKRTDNRRNNRKKEFRWISDCRLKTTIAFISYLFSILSMNWIITRSLSR